MRITFGSLYRNGLDDLQRTAGELVRREREVSSGRRIHAASDDPAAASLAAGARAEVRAIDRYGRAVDSADARLRVIDTVLGEVVDGVSRARTLAVAAASALADPARREAYALEATSLRDSLAASLNTSLRGVYLFAGTRATQPPFPVTGAAIGPYAGDGGEQRLDVDRARTVAVTVDGRAIVQGEDPSSLFDLMDSLAQAIRSQDLAGVEAVMRALEPAEARVAAAQSRVGAALAAVEPQKARLSSLARSAETQRAALEEVDLAAAIVAMQRAQAAHEAAVAAVGAASRVSLLDYLP
jgi:flagellar hook-associated protein 3 FlgL